MAVRDKKRAETEPEPAQPYEAPAPDAPQAYFNRELSWLGFARRVLALVEDHELPLLERLKFAGIMGMLHDEFFMKRIGGLKRLVKRGDEALSLDGRRPIEELMICREEVLQQVTMLGRLVNEELRPALAEQGIPLQEHSALSESDCAYLTDYFENQVQPILTPLVVDAEHPFPFISNLGLNLIVQIKESKKGRKRLVRVKVPNNRPRWVQLPNGAVPLEQVIRANMEKVFPDAVGLETYAFRVTRGAEGETEDDQGYDTDDMPHTPGSIIAHVTDELKARRFAGVVRLEVSSDMPDKLISWLAEQIGCGSEDTYITDNLLGLSDLLQFKAEGHEELRYPHYEPVTHPRLRDLDHGPDAMFEEIRRGDILLHHPYDSFDSSVLRFLRAASADPQTLAIKVTIYRTSRDSPIMQALLDAARSGKQVAVLVEITARFDEQPNIEWGRLLEKEGAHVAYGVERLKTHVKLALVVREEPDGLRRYVHVSTGNYHTGTARIYEDLGVLSCDPRLCKDAAQVFNELTGATPYEGYSTLLVAPRFMRSRFLEMVAREAEHAAAGRPCGIYCKMNQLQDSELITALYRAGQAGVPVTLNIRGLNCLRPGVAGLSDTIRVYSVVGRFLEHSRIYRFENGGSPEFYIGSADWMRRNLDRRVETIMRVDDPAVRAGLEAVIAVYEQDNCSAWDCAADGQYSRRHPAEGEERRAAQDVFIARAGETLATASTA
jgi:polyphosphate kinase